MIADGSRLNNPCGRYAMNIYRVSVRELVLTASLLLVDTAMAITRALFEYDSQYDP